MNFRSTIGRFWTNRSGGERFMLMAVTTTLLVGMLYTWLWDPGLEERRQLSAALPRLRAQLAEMRHQQKEIAELRSQQKPALGDTEIRAILQDSAARSHVAPLEIKRIESLAGRRALVLMNGVDFARWLEWVRNLQREFGIRVETSKIVALDSPGLVQIEATFIMSTAEAARASR